MDRRHTLPRTARLRRSREIRAMFRTGRRHSGQTVDAFVRPASGSGPRIGVVVPRHGRSIVDRNRLRRRLLELLRTEWLPRERTAVEPRDILLRARPAAYTQRFDALRDELIRCLGAPTC